MKLEEIQIINEEDKELPGTYAGVRFCDDTKSRIKAFIEENEIPESVADEKLHTTVLYSRKHLPDFSAAGDFNEPYEGTPTEFDLWESQPDEEGNTSNCLVLQYDCDPLVERHNSLMEEHGATFDFDEYKPHVTLSYNVGDLDLSNLNPSKIGPINIVHEYQEDLNTNWAKDNSDMTDE